MTIEQIVQFAKENKVDSFFLQLAANEMDKLSLHDKLEKYGGIYKFTDESSYPYLICSCFDEIVELRVDSLHLDKDGNTIMNCTDKDNSETYELTDEDFLIGQLRLIVNEII